MLFYKNSGLLDKLEQILNISLITKCHFRDFSSSRIELIFTRIFLIKYYIDIEIITKNVDFYSISGQEKHYNRFCACYLKFGAGFKCRSELVLAL